jgi:hypothetical protein
MLAQNRLQFADFAWRAAYTKWMRISEIDEFVAHLPGYPKIGIPDVSARKPEAEAKSEPVAKSESAPVHTLRHAPEQKPEPSAAAKAPQMASRFLRIPLSGKVVAAEHGNYEVLNIAERGVFVEAKEPLAIGTAFQFQLESKELGEPLQMRGVVIRHGVDQERPGFVIEFTRLNPIHKAIIEQYVRKNSK